MGMAEGKERCVSLVLGFGLSLLPALTPGVQAEQLPLKSYRTTDGLAYDYMSRIRQDSRGFLWFCTAFGLSRFDGYHFTNYGTQEGLSYPATYDLIETRDGSYWVATNGGGVCRFHPEAGMSLANLRRGEANSRFTVYPVGDEPATNRVNELCEDRQGRIWAGTDAGLFRLEVGGNQFLPVALGRPSHPEREMQVLAFVEDGEGSLWIGTKFGLSRRLPDGRMQHYSVQPLSSGRDFVLALLVDRAGRLWVGHESWMVVFKPLPAAATSEGRFPWQRLKPCRTSEEAGLVPGAVGEACLYQTPAQAFCQSQDGHLWIGSKGEGLIEFDGVRFRRYTTAHGLSSNIIEARSLTEDRDGNLWLSPSGNGVMKLARSSFVTYTESDGLGDKLVGSIFKNRAGEWYVVTDKWRINRFDGRLDEGRFTNVRVNLPPRITDAMWRRWREIIQDHAGEWWVGTTEGLYRFPRVARIEQLGRARPLAVYTARDGLASDDVTHLFEDSRGDLWIATFTPDREILSRWERATGQFHRYSDRDGLRPGQAAYCFEEDAAGGVWIGFRDGGLARYGAGRFTLFGVADGLPAGDIIYLHLDAAGRLWATAGLAGLIRIDNLQADRPRFITYAPREGLSGDYTNALTEDAQGRIYVGTPQGVDRLDSATGQIKHYTVADGLAATFPHAAFRDGQGALWFGTYKGLSRLIPQPDRPEPPPSVFINGLRIAGRVYPVSDFGQTEVGALELAASQNQMNIDFFGFNLSGGAPLRYQYRLEGAGQDWSAPTEQRTVGMSLGPGSYRFLVRAVRSDGTLSLTPAAFSFKILSPIWRRWWFLTLAALLVASVMIGFDRYRVARMKELDAALTKLRQANRTLALETEVTRILAESATPGEAAPRILEAICQSAGWEVGEIWDVEPQTGILRCADVWHRPLVHAKEFEALSRETIFLPGVGLPGRVFESREPHWISDLTQDHNFPRVAVAVKEGLRSGFGFPILIESEVIGVLEFFSREARQPDAEQIKMMSAIGGHTGQLLERKRAEQALRESETRFRTLAETASDAIITIDEASTIIFVNPAAEQVFGYSMAEMVGADLTMLMPEYLRHLHRAGLGRYLETGERHISWEAIELPGRHQSGREIPLEIAFGEFTRAGQRYFTGIARDITERKRAEEALRRSREERLAELERVRRRIATDLHDDIGSSLTQISILSEVLRQRVGLEDAAVNEPLSMIAGASRELVDSMRDIVWAINPQKDHLRDLTQRMRRFAADSFTARQIQFRLRLPEAEEDIQLGANLRREVFLIFKESVNNMVRHSGCTEAEIELRFTSDALLLGLSDNGRGFDLARESDGHGLLSMRDRAQGIGGELELTSRPGQGTTITLKIPLDPHRRAFS